MEDTMMKITLYFLPAIIFTLFYGFIGITTSFTAISPIVILWLVLFVVSGCLLIKKVFWSALLGMLPAIHLIYMSTQETGQVVNIELPLGIILFIFYAILGYISYKSKNKNP